MNRLELHSVTRSFGGVNAVQNVSFQVKPAQIVGLIGPNGAGKTTVVNLITGLLALTSGSIKCMDVDITTAPPDVIGNAGVTRTFQNIRLAPLATVLENVMVGFHRLERSSVLASILGLPSARAETRRTMERAHALLERFNMAKFAHVTAGSLSYGHQRRVEIMRALAAEPQLLLLDEPVAGMNDVEAAEIGEFIERLRSEGMSILLIEHNMRFVMGLCQYLYVLDGGRMIAAGEPEAVVSNDAVLEAYLGK